MEIRDYLIKHEGLRLKPYRCTAGKLTIGIGRNLDDKGITKDEALYLLDNDITECILDLKTIFPEWEILSYNRSKVLIDLRFQLGAKGFRDFKRLIQGVLTSDWKLFGRSIRESKLYKQAKNRCEDNIKLMEEG